MSDLLDMFGFHGPVAASRLISSRFFVFSASIFGSSGSWMYSGCLPRCLAYKLAGRNGVPVAASAADLPAQIDVLADNDDDDAVT